MLKLSLNQMNQIDRRQGSMEGLDKAISSFKPPAPEQEMLDAFEVFDKDGNGLISAGM